MGVYSVDRLISETRRLAAEYRRTTGKSLPVTAEIAVHDAIRLLQLEPAPEGTVGYDAISRLGPQPKRVQVKGRAIFDEHKSGHRIGQLKANQDWDAVVLVLMDDRYQTTEIFEADRQTIIDALEETEGSQRSKRGAMSVARFKIIGRLVWTLENGIEEDGYWDNTASA
jgi:hypothetical protein